VRQVYTPAYTVFSVLCAMCVCVCASACMCVCTRVCECVCVWGGGVLSVLCSGLHTGFFSKGGNVCVRES